MIFGPPKTKTVKFVILGDHEVGKTSIRKQFIGSGFRQKYTTTIGTEFSNKIINLEDGKLIDLQIWDIAAQSSYSKIRKQKFLKKPQGAIIAFDVTREATFKTLTHWLEELFDANPKSTMPIVIAGNKVDLKWDREVTADEGTNFVSEIANDWERKIPWIQYIETSAKSGLNIDLCFQLLGDNLELTQ